MKKIAVFLICIAAACSLSGCSDKSADLQVDVNQSYIPDAQTLLEDAYSGLNYDTITATILQKTEWQSPSDIPMEELLGWYIRSNPTCITKYQAENTQELHIPAEEFENAAFQFFGLQSEYLRNSNTYHVNDHFYTFTTQAEEDLSIVCSVTRATIRGDEVIIYFDLSAGEDEPAIGMLTIHRNGNSYQAISCVQVLSDALEEEEHGEMVFIEKKVLHKHLAQI